MHQTIQNLQIAVLEISRGVYFSTLIAAVYIAFFGIRSIFRWRKNSEINPVYIPAYLCRFLLVLVALTLCTFPVFLSFSVGSTLLLRSYAGNFYKSPGATEKVMYGQFCWIPVRSIKQVWVWIIGDMCLWVFIALIIPFSIRGLLPGNYFTDQALVSRFGF